MAFKSWKSTSLTPTIAASITRIGQYDHVQSVLAIPYRAKAFSNLSTSKSSIIRWESGLNKIAACEPDIAQVLKENASWVGRRS